ncbi:MAG: alpha/beta hydrolase [Bdellovibrionales bacterium]|nr:alpha/beta hydrolase [Ramlibacter sp.]
MTPKGAAPTWILLRGWAREARHWGGFPPQLAQAMAASRVVALDLPGCGALYRERSHLRIEDMAEHCRAQTQALGMAPPYHLLALSMGGMVAATWAARHPREVAGMVLINTSMRPFSRVAERLRPANYAALARLALGRPTARRLEQEIHRMTSNRPADDAVLAHWLALREAAPVRRGNAFRQLIAAARYSAPRSRPAVPTLVLASEQDRLVSVACSQALARQWQYPLKLHPFAGHDLPLDDAPWVLSQVSQWLRECRQR